MSEENDSEWLSKILSKWGKVQVADYLRLMGDNQQTLDRANRADASFREHNARVREALAKRVVPDLEGPTPIEPADQEGGEGMKIMIDSPTTTTVHHHGPAAEASVEQAEPSGLAVRPAVAWVKRAAVIGAMLASVGMGVTVPWLLGALTRKAAPPAAGRQADRWVDVTVEKYVPDPP